ncbi:MAG: hypothetical protein D6696_09955 [Acidobacteria bacterium]|nr:MAG: hypothetical protein D6696_09955 [Acidobacteriota bacterium]
MASGRTGLDRWTAIAANLVIFGLFAFSRWLEEADAEVYYRSVQEDEFLEWGTFWAFMVAMGVFFAAAWWQRRATRVVPWFLAGVGLFCFAFAMEEVSWGQRLLGYQPPEYFLEHNFQQELNVHNVISTSDRKLILKTIILGYGVAFPLAMPLLGWLLGRRGLERSGIVAPPWQLMPSFVATWAYYHIGYNDDLVDWSYSGEWVEMMLGLLFLIAAVTHARDFRARLAATPQATRSYLVPAAAAVLLVVVLAGVNTVLWRMERAASPAALEAARTEVEALAQDFVDGRAHSRCNTHRRLYTFVERYDQDGLFEGSFAALADRGLPEERARYFIDPWGSPYWIRDRCSKSRGRRITFIYSFGPNRRRDSSRYEILGDDVGAYVRGAPPHAATE